MVGLGKTGFRGQVFALLDQGFGIDEIVERLRCTREQVLWQRARWRKQAEYARKDRMYQERQRRAKGIGTLAKYRGQVARRDKMIAAIARVYTYAEAAKKCGLRNRNVVAGMVSRHRRRQRREADDQI